MNTIHETQITIISEDCEIKGNINFKHLTRVHGKLFGEVFSHPGSTLILNETAIVEGNIKADVLVIDGFVRGDIDTTTRVYISSTGRVIGNIKTPSLKIEAGAHLDGQCKMDQNKKETNKLSEKQSETSA